MTHRMVAVIGVLLMLASAAVAQKAPASGTDITVSKAGGTGMFHSIQEAVNAAAPGQVIEILDEGVYEEQVTIDGRADKVWAKNGHTVVPVGGKTGITIRYVPTAGAAVSARPVVKYKDTHNVSPINSSQGKIDGDDIGMAGNFQTNGAIRILNTSGVTIEGLIVDGGGIFRFRGAAAWGTSDMAHGNSCIAVALSGGVQIRDCQLRNAVFGIAVKDRNPGGVFANLNQADLDEAIPLSGFGKTGNHLFEYNRIYDNETGIFFESLWDLGSSIRYNLFYRNYRRNTTNLTGTYETEHNMDRVGGALKFKDNYLAPTAVYNNTLYQNERFMAHHWQVGGQHLVFNNIVAGARDTVQSSHGLDGKLPRRMHHNTWSAGSTSNEIMIQHREGYGLGSSYNCIPARSRDTSWIYRVYFISGLPYPAETTRRYTEVLQCELGGLPYPYTVDVDMTGPLPGATISGTSTSPTALPASSNNRWLEMGGRTVTDTYYGYSVTLPNLFQSLTESDPNFLEPDWAKEEVVSFIRNKGWAGTGDAVGTTNGAGILDWAGTGVADIGAIQFNGKRPCSSTKPSSRARIMPISVVTIGGTGNTVAKASFILSEDIASSLNAPAIKYIRWIAPIPDNAGQDAYYLVEDAAIKTASLAAGSSLAAGVNRVEFTIPSMATLPDYGFFELVIEGVDGIGRKIVTDVGFLPYRKLDQYLDIQVVDAAGTVIPNPTVSVGDPVNIKITAMNMVGTAYTGAGPLNAEFRLLSDPSARLWREVDPEPSDPLVQDNIAKVGTSITKTYTVYFAAAGKEIVLAAGAAPGATATAPPVAFMGDLSITVTPQPPARVAFRSPISKSLLPVGVPPTGMTGYYAVEVEVQDKYGNPAGAGAEVSIMSTNTAVATVLPSKAVTDAGGVARFVAQAAEAAAAGAVFDMIAYAVINSVVMLDTASLRIDGDTPDVTPPVVVSASYVFAGGMISQMRVTLNKAAEAEWFAGAEIVLDGTPIPVSNAACLSLDPADAKILVLDYVCAFGAIIPEALAATAGAVISFDPSLGWQPLTITPADIVSILERERVVPKVAPDVSAVVVVPTNSVGFELTVGPNPVKRDDGIVKFFVGATAPGRPPLGIGNITGKLTIYDAVGNAVRKIKIGDVPVGADPRVRPVAEWDLRDSKNRPVSIGTYLARGVIKVNGKREKVSIVIGVR